MNRLRWAAVGSAVVALLLAACARPVNNTTTTRTPPTTTTPPTSSVTTTSTAGVQSYVAALKPVNRSGVVGEAIVMVRGSTMSVQVRARGLVSNKQHAQHIHGFAGSKTSTCPPSASGTVMQEPQAETYYGQVLVPLEPFPTADASGAVSYRGSVNAQSNVPTVTLLPLEGRAIVVHGLMVNGTYEAGVPVACGELRLMTGATTTTPGGNATSGVGTTGP